jgi:uncharacterized protein
MARPPAAPIAPPPGMTPDPPDVIPPTLLRMRWAQLTYLHWDLDPREVAARLPSGLEPDVIDGRAWVGLVPFHMAGIRLEVPGSRQLPLPWSSFPETNVRTYVVGPDGGRGVYFHSLDVPYTAPTAVARLGFRLPYCTSTMRIAQRGDRIGYLARRRWPRPTQGPAATSRVIVEVGPPVATVALTPRDVALSARWALYTDRPGGGILKVDVHHAAWSLREARLLALDDGLVNAAGYRLHGRPPIHVRAADAVEVRVGRPVRVA